MFRTWPSAQSNQREGQGTRQEKVCHIAGLVLPYISNGFATQMGSLQLHGLYSPWNSPGQNTGVGSLSFLQGILPTQGLNPGRMHCRRILYQLSHKGSPGAVRASIKQCWGASSGVGWQGGRGRDNTAERKILSPQRKIGKLHVLGRGGDWGYRGVVWLITHLTDEVHHCSRPSEAQEVGSDNPSAISGDRAY